MNLLNHENHWTAECLYEPSKPQKLSKPFTSTLSSFKLVQSRITNKPEKEKQGTEDNKSTISDLVKMLGQFQMEIKNNFSQQTGEIKVTSDQV